MADETAKGGELDPLSRPLPSVNMPLLRGQVRAERTRRVALTAVGGVIAVGGIAAAVVLGPSQADTAVEPETESTAVLEAPAAEVATTVETAPAETPATATPEPTPAVAEGADGTQRFTSSFGNARGFRPALTNAGLSEGECAKLEEALTDVLDFRRCRPDHQMKYERTAEGRLVRFEYHDQPTSYVLAQIDEEGGVEASRVEIPVEQTRIVRGGTVQSSLGDAIAAVGLGRQLVGVFVEVFDGKVNFSTQARAGDAFRVVLDEERMNGEFLRFGQVHALEYVGQRAGTLRAFWYKHRSERSGDWYDDDGRGVRGGWLRVPCRYDRISSPYNPRRMHPILRRIVPHNGVDFAASTGTPVWAAADGTVTWAGEKGANGNLVSIRHADGYESHYAHLHRIQRGIRRGAEVTRRQLIGTVGSTGRSTGPHLHFGLKRRGRFVDPMAALNGPGRQLPAGKLAGFRRVRRDLLRELETVRVTAPEIAETPVAREANNEEVPMD